MINHPSYYKNKDGKECIDCMIEEYGIEAAYHFCVFNAYKYRWRAGLKDGNSKEQDLAKMQWYIDKAIELGVQ